MKLILKVLIAGLFGMILSSVVATATWQWWVIVMLYCFAGSIDSAIDYVVDNWHKSGESYEDV